jgi:hypothetical protein
MDKNKSIVSSLAESNTTEATLKLKEYANKILANIADQNNDKRFESLEFLERFAFRVPKESLAIIGLFADEKLEKPSMRYEKPFLFFGHTHKRVLEKCLEILRQYNLRYGFFDECLIILIKFLTFKPKDIVYEDIRKKAREIIIDTANYNLKIIIDYYQGYKFQNFFVKKVQKWIIDKEDKIFFLAIDIIGKLFEPELEGTYWDNKTVTIKFGPAKYTKGLRKLRQQLIRMIFSRIENEKNRIRKLSLVSVLADATRFPIRGIPSDNLELMIMDNIKMIIHFYNRLNFCKTNPEILQEIEKQVSFEKRRFAEYKRKNKAIATTLYLKAQKLLQKLRKDNFYKVYRNFVGDLTDFWDEKEDYDKININRQQQIEKIINTINTGNISKWAEMIIRISESYGSKQEYEFANLRFFGQKLGETKPEFAFRLINILIKKKFSLKSFYADLLLGIRKTEKISFVYSCIDKWIKVGDFDLIKEIPYSYWCVEEKYIRLKDVNIFEKLARIRLEKEKRFEMDLRILRTLPWIYKIEPRLCDKLLFSILRRLPEKNLSIFSDTMMMAEHRKQIEIKKWPSEVLKNILKEFLNKEKLDYHDEEILSIYAEKDPRGLIDFFRKRMDISRKKNKKERGLPIKSYDAVPFELGKISQAITAHKEYKNVINKILSEWMERKDWQLQWEGKHFIHELSSNLDETLRKELLHKIRGKEKKKIIGALEVLDAYQGSSLIDDLCKEAIKESRGNKNIKNIVGRALYQTGVVTGEYGFRDAYKHKLERIKNWLKDENKHVKNFAREFSDSLKKAILREEKKVQEEQMRLKKGVDL